MRPMRRAWQVFWGIILGLSLGALLPLPGEDQGAAGSDELHCVSPPLSDSLSLRAAALLTLMEYHANELAVVTGQYADALEQR